MKKVSVSAVMGIFSVALFGFTPHVSAELKVVTSIKPVHSLVSAVMGDAGSSELLIEGASSPHAYAMRPSQARSLQDAGVVFWVGPELEAFLVKPIATTAKNAISMPLMESEGLSKRAFRDDDGDHDENKHDEDKHDHAEHDHGAHGKEAIDPHIWLDPENAKAMARSISIVLSAADPVNATLYSKNAANLLDRLGQLSDDLQATIKPLQDKKYVVFHDAYQYFEARYGMESAGAIALSPDVLPGADHLRQIKTKVASLGATCVFAEPQFKPKLVEVVIEGTDAKSAVLDPLGAGIDQGPEQYFDLMKAMASSMRDCLS